jgi:antitoxin component YwqK of YwqJK toxin-antitoxin module
MRDPLLVGLAAVCLVASACSDPAKEQLRKTTIPTYDKGTGRLKELTFDQNKNGTIDTWTEMDAARPVLTRMDRNEDGKLDRWEYYDQAGKLEKVGFSRKDDGKPDAWAFAGADGSVERIEISSAADVRKIDRWEHYEGGGLVRAEEDTDGDGALDKWETYEAGAVRTAAFDETHDGKPDRRLTYSHGALALIETEPDGAGNFTRRTEVKQ